MRRLRAYGGVALLLGAVAPAWAAPEPAPETPAPEAAPAGDAPAPETPSEAPPVEQVSAPESPAAEPQPPALTEKKGKKASMSPIAAIAETPADLPPVICTAPGGQLHLVVKQPDRSTWAAGPGECWLTLEGTHPTSPVRLYLAFEAPGKRMGAELGDTAKDAIQWAKDHDLFRGKVEDLESGQISMGDVAAPFHRLRGLPYDGDTTRELIFAHVNRAGQDIVVVAHWDAHHPAGLGDEAARAIRGMSVVQGERPSLTATPEPEKGLPSAPEGGPLPAALGEVPVKDVEKVLPAN